MNQHRNILIMNLTRMGDLVQSTPLVSGLRKKYPDARLTLMVNRDFLEFSRRIAGIDDRIGFDLRQFNGQGLDSRVTWVKVYRYLESFLEKLQKQNFDLVINLSHSKLSALMISYLEIPEVRGFVCNQEGNRMTRHPWLQYFFTEPFNRPYNAFNLVDIFMRGGDIEGEGRGVELLNGPADEREAEPLLESLRLNDGSLVIGIQAGSSLKGRRWPAASFAQLADLLIDSLDARIILFGVASESPLAGEIISRMRNPKKALDLTGKTNIAQLVGSLKQCRYLVTNDTGTMHIAAALGVRIVGLFFAHAHPYETGPYSEGHVVFQARIPCAPCSYGVECNNIVCIQKVRPEHVFSLLEHHCRTGQWAIPNNFLASDELQVYETGFDHNGFFRLRNLIPHPINIQDFFREAYRIVWRRNLGNPKFPPLEKDLEELRVFLNQNYDCNKRCFSQDALKTLQASVARLAELGLEGLSLTQDVIKICRTHGVEKSRLESLVNRIDAVDDRVQRLGWSHPELKPLVDMFAKRKENLEGDNVLRLAEQSGEYYRQLTAESEDLAQILSQSLIATGLEEGDGYAETSSSKVAVPGK